jgi:hypothetical protein
MKGLGANVNGILLSVLWLAILDGLHGRRLFDGYYHAHVYVS